MPVLVPPNEARRALRAEDARSQTSETVRTSLHGLARFASRYYGTRFAAVTLVDQQEICFLGKYGPISVDALPRDAFFCGTTVGEPSGLVVEDAQRDARFRHLRLVQRKSGIRFYVGAPIVDASGLAIGTVCAFDTTLRELPTPFEREVMHDLAGMAASQLGAHRGPPDTGPTTPLPGTRQAAASTPTSTPALGVGGFAEAMYAMFADDPHRLQAHLDAYPQAITVRDAEGVFVLANVAAADLYGYRRDHLIGRTEADLVEPSKPGGDAAADAVSHGFERVTTVAGARLDAASCQEEELVDAHGRRRFFTVTRHAVEHQGQVWTLSVASETTRQHRFESFTREHADLLEAAGGDTPEAMIFENVCEFVRRHLDAACVTVWMRDGAGLRYVAGGGVRSSVANGLRTFERSTAILDHVARPGALAYNGRLDATCGVPEYTTLALDGEALTLLSVPIRTVEGRPVGLLDVLLPQRAPATPEQQDIAVSAVSVAALAVEHRRRARQIAFQQFNDRLTRLPNREGFLDRLTSRLSHASRSDETVAVLVVDVDAFRAINERYGQQVGDAILQELAARLDGALRETDSLARISADEYALILTGLQDPNDAATVARKLLSLFDTPFLVAGIEIAVRGTIGVSLARTDGFDAQTLLERAYSAMHTAKQESPGGFQYYSPECHARAVERYALLTDLRRAIGSSELFLALQSQLDLHSGRTIGFEVLLRWTHPERGSVSPGVFIPLAEESGLIVELGQWVLEEACRHAKTWLEKFGEDDIRFSVNVAAAQFACPSFVDDVRLALRQARLEPRFLELEVTESMVVTDVEQTAATIETLRKLGVKVAIDDFGTGHAGFMYLMKLPADRLKLDRVFMEELVDDHGRAQRGAQVVKGIVDMAHLLGMEVVAEGVEHEAQMNYLMRIGCDHIQGYLIQRPFAFATRLLEG